MRTETEPKTEVFLAKPTETDRRQNVWNRNNTIHDDSSVVTSLTWSAAVRRGISICGCMAVPEDGRTC